MSPELTYVLYGCVFLGVLLLIEGMYYFVRDAKTGSERAANRRMRMQASGMKYDEILLNLRRDMGAKAAWMIGPIARLNTLLAETGMQITTARYIVMMIAVGVFIATGLALSMDVPIFFIVPFAVILGIIIPLQFALWKKRKRIEKFAEQLPDALDIMVRSLRAGHPISAALGLVAREMPDPIGSEFGIVVDEMTYGLELGETLNRLAKRIDHPDLHFMVISVTIQHGTGGNLAEVLNNLSTIIRSRFRLYMKVAALSAEGRLSALVLAILPFAVALLMHVQNPRYYTTAAKNPKFWFIIFITFIWYLGSMFVVRKIIKIRV